MLVGKSNSSLSESGESSVGGSPNDSESVDESAGNKDDRNPSPSARKSRESGLASLNPLHRSADLAAGLPPGPLSSDVVHSDSSSDAALPPDSVPSSHDQSIDAALRPDSSISEVVPFHDRGSFEAKKLFQEWSKCKHCFPRLIASRNFRKQICPCGA